MTNQPDVTRNLRDKAAKLREEAEFMDPLSGAYNRRLNEATQLECEADLMETVYPADVTRSDVDSLSAERKEQGWMPIESAPKDGTWIDVYCANGEFPMRYTDVQWREPTEDEWWVHGGDGMKHFNKQWIASDGYPFGGDQDPTHWMPIPEAP